jgi:thymidylate synthase
MIEFKPLNERTPDTQYQDLLRQIKENGKDKVPIHDRLEENKDLPEKGSREITGAMLSYELSNGFPLLSERNLTKVFPGAIGELSAFLNGARNLSQLEEFGCPKIWWKSWVTKEKCDIFGLKEGDLGPGSYGAALSNFQTKDGGTFNQIDALIKQIRERPYSRTHVISTWNPPYALGDKSQNSPREVVVAPCHGNFVHFVLFDDQKELEVVQLQRSADTPVGLQFNIIEWCALGMMVAHLIGYKYTKYTHMISNPHYYGVQNGAVDELLSKEPRRFPTVTLEPNRKVERLQDFRPEDFKIGDDYDPHPWFKIATPI